MIYRNACRIGGILAVAFCVGCGGGGSGSSPIPGSSPVSVSSGSGSSSNSGTSLGQSGSTPTTPTTGSGGSSSTAPGANPVTSPVIDAFAAYQVRVDLNSGHVTATPISPSGSGRKTPTSRAILTSQVVSIGVPNTIVNIPGDPGVKVVALTITNDYGVNIGTTPLGTATSGLKAILTQITNMTMQPGVTVTEPIQLSNADGTIPSFGSVANLPYILYLPLGIAGTTTPNNQTKNWNFIVPNGITGFTFTVAIEGVTANETPPQAAVGAGSTGTLVRTLAGQFGVGPAFVDGSGQNAQFNTLRYVAADALGNLFVTDANAVRRIASNGVVTTIVNLNNVPGNTNTSQPGNLAFLNGPAGIAVNPAGTILYVADTNNNQIRRIALTSATGDPTLSGNWSVSVIAGSPLGIPGGVDGAGNAAMFSGPAGIVLDQFGNLFVVESTGNRVRRVTFNGAVGASGVDVAANAANWNVQLLAGDPAGGSGAVDNTGANARFNGPSGIAIDRAGTLYVADTNNATIRNVTQQGKVTTIAGAAGSLGYVDSASGSNARFHSPGAIAVDAASYLYVTDNGTLIRRISTTGSVSSNSSSYGVETVAGAMASGAMDGDGSTARFKGLSGIAIDSSGNIYVTDSGNFTVRLVERLIP